MKLKYRSGFTLIELLVVVAVIGLIAIIIIVSLDKSRGKGIDARRKSDLIQIRTSLELYYNNCGTYIVKQNCTGAAYGSGGWGWFNTDYGNGSVAKGLVDNNITKAQIIDPTGNTSGPNAYMIAVDQNRYTIWATLNNPTEQEAATINNCYWSQYDNYSGAGTQNYCLSN